MWSSELWTLHPSYRRHIFTVKRNISRLRRKRIYVMKCDDSNEEDIGKTYLDKTSHYSWAKIRNHNTRQITLSEQLDLNWQENHRNSEFYFTIVLTEPQIKCRGIRTIRLLKKYTPQLNHIHRYIEQRHYTVVISILTHKIIDNIHERVLSFQLF